MENIWLTRVKQLQALASTGLFFGAEEFDKERYAQIHEIAVAMMHDLTTNAGPAVLAELDGLSSGQYEVDTDHAQGYVTPKVDVRGAVFYQQRILLVQERSDRLWTLPGGYADVGLSAAENVQKEVREEAGLNVVADHLYAVRHKAKHEYRPDVRDFYKMFFMCSLLEPPSFAPLSASSENESKRFAIAIQPSSEVLAAGFFALHELPDLSTGRTIFKDVELAFEHLDNASAAVQID